ncbi:hypothetical protein BHE90_012427 [Fusarium euwallaceae]|uniref:PD-(D/E)XK nuclease-like domain-containing protein n=1 Tax=Fusarium euwallaceae TaxID=1147111 RepID=A0A430LBN8_9HYPO|nr:hypothetical protein BHE90_012427 [Fusarium euwallaceae]
MGCVRYIENWLNDIPDSSSVDITNLTTEIQHPVHSKCHQLRQQSWSRITPPSSNEGMSARQISPKRKRVGSRAEDEDHDVTPRSSRVPASGALNDQQIPFRLVNIPNIPPSDSSHASQDPPPSPGTSDAPTSRRGRPKSPVKSNNNLQALDIPVDVLQLDMNGIDILPSNVHDLYRRLQDIDDKENFIPWEISQNIKSIIPDRIKDRWFFGQKDENNTQKLTAASRELEFLREIESDAKQCKLSDCSEASWNMWVHMPVLRHALAGYPAIRVEPSISAKIAPCFVPTTKGKATVVESKMIGFTLLLWLNKGSPRSTPHDPLPPEADGRLMARIANKVWSQERDVQFVNQSSYAPLQYAPIACNIETKTATSSNQGKLQLSVWTAAWFKRMTELLPHAKMPTIPLIHVVGHEWHISFASFHGSHIEVAEELSIGDTRTLLGLYQLVASLRRLGDWIETTYRKWAEDAFVEL